MFILLFGFVCENTEKIITTNNIFKPIHKKWIKNLRDISLVIQFQATKLQALSYCSVSSVRTQKLKMSLRTTIEIISQGVNEKSMEHNTRNSI